VKLAVVIAAWDERPNIEPLVRRLDAALADWRGRRQLVFVVEGEDGTHEALTALAGEIADLRVIYRRQPRGLGEAFRAGFAAVGDDADVVVTLDADLNHQPEEIPRLVAALERAGADVVVGSRDLPASRVDGIPAWKRWLSRAVNRALSRLRGIPVADKTSGFRAYRAGALRRLAIRAPGFSFLADLLLQAHAAGMVVREEPIHFTYRTQGRSKLPFARTSAEYLGLVSRAVAPAERALAFWLAVGAAVRLLAACPAYRFYADADAALTALGALRILDGEPLVFFSGVRIGAIGCWATAALFALFGASRAVLALGALLFGLGTLVAAAWTARALLGPRRAIWALPLIALPAPAVLFWTSMPVGYGEIELLSALALLTATLLARRGGGGGRLAVFALVAGLGFWTSMLTLCATLPAALLVLRRRADLLRSARAWAAAAGGFLLGSLPWWLANLSGGFEALAANRAARPVLAAAALADNAAYALGTRLPQLLAWTRPLRAFGHGPAALTAIAAVLLAIWGAWVVLALRPVAREAPTGAGAGSPLADARFLVVGVTLATLLANVVSAAGAQRGETVRYLLPLALVLPLLPALAAGTLRSPATSRMLAGSVALVALFGLTAPCLPWHPWRIQGAAERREDSRILERLDAAGVEALTGDFSQVMPFNFLSARRLLAVPVDAWRNSADVERRLPARPLRWALLGRGEREREWLVRCGSVLLPGGRLERAGAQRWLWLGGSGDGIPGASGAAQLARVREVCATPRRAAAAP
jgi:dolichol-phosphate mannosyltransferase